MFICVSGAVCRGKARWEQDGMHVCAPSSATMIGSSMVDTCTP